MKEQKVQLKLFIPIFVTVLQKQKKIKKRMRDFETNENFLMSIVIIHIKKFSHWVIYKKFS